MSERRASCPNCGAEIVFRWSGAVQTTCPACRSILVRHDLELEKVGRVADVLPSPSLIQLGTEGRFKGESFVVVGRIMYRYEAGHWNEWHLRLAGGSSAWLSDAQGEFAVSRSSRHRVALRGVLGEQVQIEGKGFAVTSVTTASYAGVEGELPFEYWDKGEVRFIDLKAHGDAFATLDESEDPPRLFLGEYESFEELRLTNLGEQPDEQDTRIRSRGLNCPSCGAAIDLITGSLAMNAACGACGSIIDTRDPNLRILQQHADRTGAWTPQIPIGQAGRLKGREWRHIGFQVRSITVDDASYYWREYLLWSPDGGFRYLTEYDGHWNDIATIRGLPRDRPGTLGHPEVEYLGTRFRHFQSAVATTEFVLGEFPWEVRVGDQVATADYVSPPLMLSSETTDTEITWSLGTYTSPRLIKEAFGLKGALPVPRGIFANQPNPLSGQGASLSKMFLVFALALVAMLFIRLGTARKEQVFSDGFRYRPTSGDSGAFVTRVFELRGRSSNVEIRLDTDIENDWAYFHLALLPENGGAGYELGREISRYVGIEDGERWAEGSQRDRVLLSAVPAGRYFLRVEPEHQGFPKPFTYTITVRRDVPRFWPFLIGILVLSVAPLIALIRQSSFESSRWAESDHAPVVTSGEDDEE